MKIGRGVSELWRVENRPLPLTWPMAYTTACTTVQAVISLSRQSVALVLTTKKGENTEKSITNIPIYNKHRQNLTRTKLTNLGLVTSYDHLATKWIVTILHSSRCPHGAAPFETQVPNRHHIWSYTSLYGTGSQHICWP